MDFDTCKHYSVDNALTVLHFSRKREDSVEFLAQFQGISDLREHRFADLGIEQLCVSVLVLRRESVVDGRRVGLHGESYAGAPFHFHLATWTDLCKVSVDVEDQ